MTLPTEMELRVAKALDPDAFSDAEPDYGRGHQANRAAKAIDRARAAIRAMRTPTEEMMATYKPWRKFKMVNQWQALIDAASPPEEA